MSGGGEEAAPKVALLDPGEAGVVHALQVQAVEGVGEAFLVRFSRKAGGVFTQEDMRKQNNGHERNGTAFRFGNGREE